ncbi:MAG TPA: AAA family ATPase, partial [Nocardioides sp.]|uniref:ATP-dependent DNA helicase n=1 Tax=Nocardioides sp. TaxID=35761 RepID=UPI002E2F2E81
DGQVRVELTEDLTSRALDACLPLLDRRDVPEHVRNLTSQEVLDVEADLTTRLTNRAQTPVSGGHVWSFTLKGLDPTQRRVVEAIAGRYRLLVIEGAAGAGKTATLKAAARALAGSPAGSLTVVTPTRKAAQVASSQLETAHAVTAMQLVYAYGFRKGPDGRWSRTDQRPDRSTPGYVRRGSVLLVDEAGMLDQDAARALLTIGDETGAQVVLMGDRHQLPAVGRGGVLDLAARWVPPGAQHTLETVHRFTDPDYAALTLLMRTGERPGEVFDTLLSRGQIVLHPTEVERLQALTSVDDLVVADTREQVAALNAATRDHRLTTGQTDPSRWLTTDAGERIGIGDTVATRRNDPDLDVANRDTWTVTALDTDGTLHLQRRTSGSVGERSGERRGERTVPAAYAREHVELAYATTAHGAQGDTVDRAHLVLGEHTSAASAYVAMTRGRHHNTAHLVADNIDDARSHWIETFTRDRADLGPTHAAQRAAEDIDRYGSVILQAAALRAQRIAKGRRPHRNRDPEFTTYQSPRGPAEGIGR